MKEFLGTRLGVFWLIGVALLVGLALIVSATKTESAGSGNNDSVVIDTSGSGPGFDSGAGSYDGGSGTYSPPPAPREVCPAGYDYKNEATGMCYRYYKDYQASQGG